MSPYIERTPNGTLMIHQCCGTPAMVLEIVDRFGQKIYPDPEATDEGQARIEDRLKHYSTRRGLDKQIQQHNKQWMGCEHGLPKSVCTICPDEERHDYA